MIKDAILTYSDAQAVTATADSTNWVDAGTKGDALDGNELWLVVRCKTAAASAANTAIVTITFVTADDSGFSTNLTTLFTSVGYTVPMVAGKVLALLHIPVGMRQFSKVTYTVTVQNLNAGTFDAFLAQDVDVLL